MSGDDGGASIDAVLDRFFAALEAGDIETVGGIYDPDVQVWLNVTAQAINRDESLGVLRYFTHGLVGMRYEILERRTWDGGAVQRHVVHGKRGDRELAIQACIVFHLTDGHITHVYEYLDAKETAEAFGISDERLYGSG
ncbi:MAG: nuclear transport factor 2 family protein [Acidimicrobiales bacterium]|jgi:ketosteroid isomerase-like protein